MTNGKSVGLRAPVANPLIGDAELVERLAERAVQLADRRVRLAVEAVEVVGEVVQDVGRKSDVVERVDVVVADRQRWRCPG